MTLICCLDVGSTYTKAAVVDTTDGRLVLTGQHPTTVATDVWHGVSALRDQLAARLPAVADAEIRASSSAGGGLRLAVVGYERTVTAEAGRRAGLSAGARVVGVWAGPLDPAGLAALGAAEPDVLLLVGGTDGGNAEVLLHNARALAGTVAIRAPVVVAGNADAGAAVAELLTAAGLTAVRAANVLPRIGVLDPLPARTAIRGVFVRHVIGGGRLSRDPRFAAAVRGATPEVVLSGVELLAEVAGEARRPAEVAAGAGGAADVLVVDVGGATTDVYSVLTPDPEEQALRRDVVETAWHGRSVEGDLGTRWTAPGVVAAALAERLIDDTEAASLLPATVRRVREGWTDGSGGAVEAGTDRRLAGLAVSVALRRHARPEHPGGRGRDLRPVALIVGSGGALRRAGPVGGLEPLLAATRDHAGGWRVPERPRCVVDVDYRLAAAGLLAADHRAAAMRLLAPLVTHANHG
jgi:uncharacterized protein (TIGR01319 family)